MTNTYRASEWEIPNSSRFVCALTFENQATVVMKPIPPSTTPQTRTVSNVFDFMADGSDYVQGKWKYARGGFKWDRNLNKNAVYVQLPVGNDVSDVSNPSIEGGYGYDLGFVQDNFVLELQTSNYNEYQDFMALVKTNTGETPATLVIGYTNKVEEFKVIVRYCNVSSTPGTQMMKLNITLTVVSTAYT